jgi:hypothetical protein
MWRVTQARVLNRSGHKSTSFIYTCRNVVLFFITFRYMNYMSVEEWGNDISCDIATSLQGWIFWRYFVIILQVLPAVYREISRDFPTSIQEDILCLTISCILPKSRDNSIGIATGYNSRQVQETFFLLLHSVQTGSGAHPPSYPVGYNGDSFLVAWSWPLTSIYRRGQEVPSLPYMLAWDSA